MVDQQRPPPSRAPGQAQPQSAPRSPAGRVPPHDLDAEAAVIAAILLNREALDRVIDLLKPEQAYSDANGRILEAAFALAAVGSPVDITTIASWLRARGRLEAIGGSAYLMQLVDATPAVAHVEAHARVVVEKWRLRRLIAACQKVTAEAYGDVGDASEFIAAAEVALLAVADNAAEARTPTLGQAIVERVDNILAGRAATGGIGTGLPDLDRQLGPMLPSDLIVVGAHSGIGKSSLAMQIGLHVATTWAIDPDSGKACPASALAFSMEMSRAQIADRAALASLGIDTSKAARGLLTDEEKAKLAGLADKIKRQGTLSTLLVDDRGNLTPQQIRATTRRAVVRAKREGAPLRLVIVDYLQLADGSAGGRGGERREREVAFIAEQLKALAKELGIVVLAVAQLNEDARTANRLPRGEDLRESKGIRMAADKVMLLHNDYALDRRTGTAAHDDAAGGPRTLAPEVVDVIVDKNRGVPEGRVCVEFWPTTSSFSTCSPLNAREHLAASAARREAQRAPGRGR